MRETNRNTFRIGHTITLQWTTTAAAAHQKAYRLQKRPWPDNAPKNSFLWRRVPTMIYEIRVYKAHTRERWPTRILHTFIIYVYSACTMTYICTRANKSDRNLTDQISGQSFDDHVEQFNSQSPPHPIPPYRHAISLAVYCASLDFSLPCQQFYSPICGPNFWQSPSSYTLRPSRLSGARSLPLNDRSSTGGRTGGYVRNP